MNFDEFKATVFEQISNSYQKLVEPTVEIPVPTEDIPTTTEEQLKDEEEEEEGEEEEDYNPEIPPPVATVR